MERVEKHCGGRRKETGEGRRKKTSGMHTVGIDRSGLGRIVGTRRLALGESALMEASRADDRARLTDLKAGAHGKEVQALTERKV